MSKTKRTTNYIFVKRTLESSKNKTQLDMAEKMIWQYSTIDLKGAEDLMGIYLKKKLHL